MSVTYWWHSLCDTVVTVKTSTLRMRLYLIAIDIWMNTLSYSHVELKFDVIKRITFTIKTKMLIHMSITSQLASINALWHMLVNLSLKTVKYIKSIVVSKVTTNIHNQTCTIYVDYIWEPLQLEFVCGTVI